MSKRKRNRSYQANYQLRNRARGACALCGAPSPRYRCPACRTKVREAQRLLMQSRRKRGLA